MCGWPSSTRDDRRAAAGNSALEDRRVALGEPGARLEGAEEQVGAGDAHDLDRAPASSASASAAAIASGTSAPIDRDHDPRRLGRPQPVAAGQHVLARASPASSPWSIGRVESRKYAELPSSRPSRESACRNVHSKSCANAGSQATQPGCSIPIDGVITDWCAPPSGPSVTPDGVPTRIDCPPA